MNVYKHKQEVHTSNPFFFFFFFQKSSPKASVAKHEAMQPTVPPPRVDIFVSHNPGKKTQLIGHITQHLNHLLGSSQSAEIKYSINVMKLIQVIPKITQGRILDVKYFGLPLYQKSKTNQPTKPAPKQ